MLCRTMCGRPRKLNPHGSPIVHAGTPFVLSSRVHQGSNRFAHLTGVEGIVSQAHRIRFAVHVFRPHVGELQTAGFS